MNRPLVVFAGQGISLADGFDLTGELQKLVPELFEQFSEADRDNLDLVLAHYRDLRPGEQHATLHRWIKQLTEPEELFGRRLCTVMNLCVLLKKLSRERLVVLFTSNVDRACRLAAVANGAEWFFGRSIVGATSILAMLRWIEAIKCSRQGFHYFPLHGEPDFGSTGDGGLYFATIPQFKDWNPAGQSWFSTTAEGLGPHAKTVDKTWNISKFGYVLLRDLLSGRHRPQMKRARQRQFGYGLLRDLLSGCCGPEETCDGADFLVVGYGARATDQRCEYPFERTIQATIANTNARKGAWHVVSCFGKSEPEQASYRWFKDRKFETHAVGSPDGSREPTCTKCIEEVLRQLYPWFADPLA